MVYIVFFMTQVNKMMIRNGKQLNFFDAKIQIACRELYLFTLNYTA